MKRWAVPAAAAAVAWAVGPGAARAEEKGAFGIGLILGEPTGVSAKLYLSDDKAVDAAVGGAVVGGGIQAHADYLWHPWVLTNEESFVMPAYLGLGARVLQHDPGGDDENDFHTGVRLVAGILFDFRNIPLDVFVEGAVIGEWKSGSDSDPEHGGFGPALNIGLGGRYFF
jgi:hypothetical protein